MVKIRTISNTPKRPNEPAVAKGMSGSTRTVVDASRHAMGSRTQYAGDAPKSPRKKATASRGKASRLKIQTRGLMADYKGRATKYPKGSADQNAKRKALAAAIKKKRAGGYGRGPGAKKT